MNHFKWSLFTLVGVLLLLASCKNEEHSKQAIEYHNQIVFSGDSTNFNSMFAIDYMGFVYVFASPWEGITSLADINEQTEYVLIGFCPDYIGKEMDLHGDIDCMMISIKIGNRTISHAKGSEQLQGKLRFDVDGNQNFNLSMKALTIDNQEDVGVGIQGIYERTNSDNWYSAGNNVEIIRSGFYIEEDGMVKLYLTSADLLESKELAVAFNYFAIVMDESLLGQGVNMATEAKSVAVAYLSNIGEKELSCTAGDGVTSGQLRVDKGDQVGNYRISFDFTSHGTDYRCEFDGALLDYNYTIPNANAFTVGDDSYAINSVVISSVGDDYYIYLSPTEDLQTVEAIVAVPNAVVLTLPKDLATGDFKGFSQDGAISIAYSDVTYNAACNARGNVSLKIVDSSALIEFTLYQEPYMTGYFKGEVVLL